MNMPSSNVTNIGFPDASLRPGWYIDDINTHTKINPEEQQHYILELGSVLTTIHSDSNDDNNIYLIPLGIEHKDHIITHQSASQIFRNFACIFYEDSPYVLSENLYQVSHRVRIIELAIGQILTPLRLSRNFDSNNWFKHLSTYSSQFSTDDFTFFSQTIAERGGERLWANSAALRLLHDNNINYYI